MRSQILRKAGWLTGGPGSIPRGLSTTYPGFVDAFPGATGAYSFRKTRANYTGNAVLLRRDWDSTDMAFGFVGNQFDVAGADAWIHQFDPGTLAYGRTWYDQTGNGNHFSSVNITQPLYTVSAGRPAFYFPSGKYLYSSTDDGVSSNIPLSAFMPARSGYVAFTGALDTVPSVVFSDDGSFMGMYFADATPDTYAAFASDGSARNATQNWDAPLWGSIHTYEWVHNAGNITSCIDGGSDTSVACGAIPNLTNYCYMMADHSSFGNGTAWEVAIYATPPPRAGLVANMLGYLTGATYPPPMPSGLTHRWPMTNAYVSGSTIVDTIGGLNGTAGDVHSVAGPASGLTARYIERTSNGQIDLSSGPIPNLATGAWTIAVWLWRDNTGAPTGGSLPLCCKLHDGSTGYAMGLKGSTGTPLGDFNIGDFAALSHTGSQARDVKISSFTFPVSTWMHVAVSYDGSNPARMYLNGEDRTQACTGVAISEVDGTNVLGAIGNDSFQDEWGGAMYDFCIFNRQLSTAEVRQLYAASLAGAV